MNETTWNDVDGFFAEHLIGVEPILDEAQARCDAAGLPSIQVSPLQGKLLHLLAKMRGARNILEIGTLGGYSTIWLARALPAGGRLVTLELDEKHAEVARQNIDAAGLSDRVEIRVGPAVDSLAKLVDEGAGDGVAFDLVFIDADKPSNPEYLQWAIKLTKSGSVIICDNVVRKGKVADANSDDPGVVGSQRFIELVGEHPKLDATAIQTVGSKGYDGLAIAVVK
jgi:predicted O-methyltransferase YrrM